MHLPVALFPLACRRDQLMADPTRKLAKNVTGGFYVDETCIDCEVCREIASSNFTRDNATRKSYVFAQPDNPADEAACLAAMDECPVEAIGHQRGA